MTYMGQPGMGWPGIRDKLGLEGQLLHGRSWRSDQQSRIESTMPLHPAVSGRRGLPGRRRRNWPLRHKIFAHRVLARVGVVQEVLPCVRWDLFIIFAVYR